MQLYYQNGTGYLPLELINDKIKFNFILIKVTPKHCLYLCRKVNLNNLLLQNELWSRKNVRETGQFLRERKKEHSNRRQDETGIVSGLIENGIEWG